MQVVIVGIKTEIGSGISRKLLLASGLILLLAGSEERESVLVHTTAK